MKFGYSTAICLAGALLAATAAYAGPSTSLDNSTSDTTRGTPDYNSPMNQVDLQTTEPETGIHMGGFMLYPTAEVDAAYNDNVFATQNNNSSDEIYKFKPGLSLQSLWSVHQLNVWANLDSEIYQKNSTENQTNYSFGANGMLEASYATHFYGSSEYDHLTEERGNTNLPGLAQKPTQYTDWASELGVAQRFNRMTIHAGGTYSQLRFDNTPAIGGGTILTDLRSRNVSTEYADAGFEFSPGYSIFARGTINQRSYTDASFGARDSNGYEFDAGVRAEITRLIQGEAWVGYLNQDYKGFSSTGGFSFGVTGIWSVTPLTTVTANIARTLEETDEAGSSGYFASGGTVTIDHELSRTIKVHVGMAYTKNDYRGIDRHETVYGPTAGADYSLTPRLAFGVSYQYVHRDTNVAGADYNENQVTAALKLAL